MNTVREKHSWGGVEIWAKSKHFVGIFYSIDARESVIIPSCNSSVSTYRVSSGILLVQEEGCDKGSDGVIITSGDSISLNNNIGHIFSAIRDCEIYGIIPPSSGEKVGKKK